MDQAAPKDNPFSKNSDTSSSVSSPPDPVQPGQFVVAGEDDGVFKEPPAPQPPKATVPLESFPFAAKTNASPSLPPIGQTPPLPSSIPPIPSQEAQPELRTPNFDLGTKFPSPNPPTQSSLDQQQAPVPQETPSPQDFQAPLANQPNPTPYVAPTPQQTPPPEPSKIKKLKFVAIAIGVLVLIGLATGAAWFFLIRNKQPQPPKTENTQVQVQEPSPIPKRTKGGFSDLSLITKEATSEATSGASQ